MLPCVFRSESLSGKYLLKLFSDWFPLLIIIIIINSYYPRISARASSCLSMFYICYPINSGLTGFSSIILPILRIMWGWNQLSNEIGLFSRKMEGEMVPHTDCWSWIPAATSADAIFVQIGRNSCCSGGTCVFFCLDNNSWKHNGNQREEFHLENANREK
jgi:hypothetical protein